MRECIFIGACLALDQVAEHQSTTGFLRSSLGWGHRRTQRGENFLWTGGLPLFLVVMTLPFLNAHTIFKSCYGSNMGLFSPLDCTGNHPNQFESAQFTTSLILWHEIASCVVVPLQHFFWGLIGWVSPLSLGKCWENYRWKLWVRGGKLADNVNPVPWLTSLFYDCRSLKNAVVSDRCHSRGTNGFKLWDVFIGHKT